MIPLLKDFLKVSVLSSVLRLLGFALGIFGLIALVNESIIAKVLAILAIIIGICLEWAGRQVVQAATERRYLEKLKRIQDATEETAGRAKPQPQQRRAVQPKQRAKGSGSSVFD